MFGPDIDRQIAQHALAEFPRESCGIVLKGPIYLKIKNVSVDPENAFEFSPADTLFALKNALAIVHSHTKNDPWPTKYDMEQQVMHGIPYGIVTVTGTREIISPFWFGDTVPVADYIGREFRHGVHDCYALQRDILRKECGITLGVRPRDYLWWEKGQNMIMEGFSDEGFTDIDLSQIKKYDVILFNIRSDRIVNHVGVYMGNGLVYHHLLNRLSRPDPVERWRKHVHKVLRHKDLNAT